MKGQPKPVKIRKNWGITKPIVKIKDSDRKNKDWIVRQHKEFGIE